MRRRLTLAAAAMLATTVFSGCGDDIGTTTTTPLETATTAATTTEAATSATSTTAPPPSPAVTWRETLDLGSTVAIRHLMVSNGVFLAVTEDDFRSPGDVPVSVFVSTDGEEWVEVDLSREQFADVVLFEAAGGPAGFIATGTRLDDPAVGSRAYVWTSSDGERWTSAELVPKTVPQPTSPLLFDSVDSLVVAGSESLFVVVAEIRRQFDFAAILDTHMPDFEWPEFAGMETKTMPGGDVQLTIDGEGGNDFIATFSELGVDPGEMPIGDAGSDFISLSMGSAVWTSADGIDWVETRGPKLYSTPPLLFELDIDATTAGWFVHGYDYAEGTIAAWHSPDGSEWAEIDLPGRPVADWSGGVYAFERHEYLWTSTNGTSWTVTAGPEGMADARQIWPAAGTPASPIAVVGMRSDAAWADGTVPETWVAVSTDGAKWLEARDVEAFGMPVWPEAIAIDGDRIMLGLVGEPESARPYSALWLGTVTAP